MKKIKKVMLVILTLTMMVICPKIASAQDNVLEFRFTNEIIDNSLTYHPGIKIKDMKLVTGNLSNAENYLEIYDNGTLVTNYNLPTLKWYHDGDQCSENVQMRTDPYHAEIKINFTDQQLNQMYFANYSFEVYFNDKLVDNSKYIKNYVDWNIILTFTFTENPYVNCNPTSVDFVAPRFEVGSDIPTKEDFLNDKWVVKNVEVVDLETMEMPTDTKFDYKKYMIQIDLYKNYFGDVDSVTINNVPIGLFDDNDPLSKSSWLKNSSDINLSIFYLIDLDYSIKTMEGQEHGKVFASDPYIGQGDLYLASIPDPGYILEKYVYIDKDGIVQDVEGNKIHIAEVLTDDLYVGAIFTKATRKIDNYQIKIINKVADMVQLDRNTFVEFIKALPDEDEFDNQAKYLLDLVRPYYYEFYRWPYECQDTADLHSLYGTLIHDPISYEHEKFLTRVPLSDEEYEIFVKEVMGLLMLSHLELVNPSQNSEGTSVLYLIDPSGLFPKLSAFISDAKAGEDADRLFDDALKALADYLEAYHDLIDAKESTIEEYYEYGDVYSPIFVLIKLLDDRDWSMDSAFNYYDNTYERYEAYIDTYLLALRDMEEMASNTELREKYSEIDRAAKEELKKWVLSDYNFDEIINNIDEYLTYDYMQNELAKIDSLKSELALASTDDEKSDVKFKLAKEEVRIVTRVFCDTASIIEAGFMTTNKNNYTIIFGSEEWRVNLSQIISKIKLIRENDQGNKLYDAIHDSGLFDLIFDPDDGYNKQYLDFINSLVRANYDDTKQYHALLRAEMREVLEPKSSGSKTYSAKNTNKTVEKISGSGKKGSKRTITPIEGRKVSSVIVRDKNGNKVDVTLNADGTYSFVQPASDVTVEVIYKNREIKLTIGSTEASVDGENSNLDVSPVIRNDRTMLPIRFIAENLGAKVEWSEKRPDYVLITKGDIKIEITLGSDIAKVNGKEYKLDSVAFAENNRTYLPVRFVSENLNAVVEWNEERPMEVLIYER